MFNKDYMLDSITGFKHKPDIEKRIEWEEHDKGFYFVRTNNLGFREDNTTAVKNTDTSIRILVCGDSHIDGVINNNESFPNVLEELLNSNSINHSSYDIINTACGYYSFKQYYGTLLKNLYLHPTQYVVTVYSGNDFIEGIMYDNPKWMFLGSYKNFIYRFKRNLTLNKVSAIKSQNLSQLLYFKMYSRDTLRAIEIAKAYMNKIDSVCKLNAIKLTVLILPTKSDVETSLFLQWQQKLKWETDNLLINRILASRLRSYLESNQIQVYDLFANEINENKYFYDSDHHLNPEGHKAIARYLFDRSFLFE